MLSFSIVHLLLFKVYYIFTVYHSPPLQHHPAETYHSSVSIKGIALEGHPGDEDDRSRSPQMSLTQLTTMRPSTPGYLQTQF